VVTQQHHFGKKGLGTLQKTGKSNLALFLQSKQKDLRRENKRIGVALEDEVEKGGE
jgi:hypothetical protein